MLRAGRRIVSGVNILTPRPFSRDSGLPGQRTAKRGRSGRTPRCASFFAIDPLRGGDDEAGAWLHGLPRTWRLWSGRKPSGWGRAGCCSVGTDVGYARNPLGSPHIGWDSAAEWVSNLSGCSGRLGLGTGATTGNRTLRRDADRGLQRLLRVSQAFDVEGLVSDLV